MSDAEYYRIPKWFVRLLCVALPALAGWTFWISTNVTECKVNQRIMQREIFQIKRALRDTP